MAENIVTGKSYKVLTDAASNSWDKVSFWTKASDVENNAGQTLQSTVGDIAGLSNNLVTTAGNFALDATQGKALNDKLGGLSFKQNDDGQWGFETPDGEFNIFGGGGGKYNVITGDITTNGKSYIAAGKNPLYICCYQAKNGSTITVYDSSWSTTKGYFTTNSGSATWYDIVENQTTSNRLGKDSTGFYLYTTQGASYNQHWFAIIKSSSQTSVSTYSGRERISSYEQRRQSPADLSFDVSKGDVLTVTIFTGASQSGLNLIGASIVHLGTVVTFDSSRRTVNQYQCMEDGTVNLSVSAGYYDDFFIYVDRLIKE